jgi:hypothetical protein
MSKRFIDTNLFNDEWFMELSKDAKLFFIYYITNCDHAGILKLNKKLFEFQAQVNDVDKVIKELGNCIVTVKNGVYFMPKYIKFQYPDFPKSNVKQQDGALKILISYGLFDEENNKLLTVKQELGNSYDNDSDNDIDIVNENISRYEIKKNNEFGGIKNPHRAIKQKYVFEYNDQAARDFYNAELELSNDDPAYRRFIETLFNQYKDPTKQNIANAPLDVILSVKHQLKFSHYQELRKKAEPFIILEKVEKIYSSFLEKQRKPVNSYLKVVISDFLENNFK